MAVRVTELEDGVTRTWRDSAQKGYTIKLISDLYAISPSEVLSILAKFGYALPEKTRFKIGGKQVWVEEQELTNLKCAHRHALRSMADLRKQVKDLNKEIAEKDKLIKRYDEELLEAHMFIRMRS